ncbi:ATP-dependent Clp protease ATP-binding subunit ClpC [Streptosporangium album]|uniref:ATP-dependent Clp protease ATP-binding subunit ClpC n=1 Tax=Streptosporangium album TaxID=47479 RepID=A0A7W7S2C3_9ACTN|nr:ATP-dependent Clp protease ATP-binding subunit ClpC [Streptosporangium album]
MFERFTDRARRVVVLAQEEARRLGHDYIGTEHILLGLLGEEDGVASRALQASGIGRAQVRDDVEKIIGQGGDTPPGHIPFTPRAKKVLELSLREALNLHHNYIGTEHILLGLIREGQGVAAQVLAKQGARLDVVRAQVITLIGRRGPDRPLTLEEGFYGTGPSFGAKLERIQESLDRIERRLDAMGAPPDPGSPDDEGVDRPREG